MAETKTSISELTAAASVGSDDLLFISQLSGSTWNSKKATVGQLPFGQGTITGITMNGASKGTAGNVDLGTVLTSVPTSYKTYTDTKTALDSVYKPLQTAKTDPTASGNATSFIDTITQNANGVITATKKTIPSASTSVAGIVQLNNNILSESTTQAATPNAVNSVYLACLRNSLDNQTLHAHTFIQESDLKQSDPVTSETVLHRIDLNDSTNRRIGDITTRKTASGNYFTGFECLAPVGSGGSDVVSYVNAFVGSDGTPYVTIPTPPSNSNSNVASTTEWVNTKLSGYKTTQTAKSSPTESGNTTSFIDTISQDSNGVITATKKTVQAASTSTAGIVQLNDTLSSTSTSQAPTAAALKSAYDACLKNSVDNQTMVVDTLNMKSSQSWSGTPSQDTTLNKLVMYDSATLVTGRLYTFNQTNGRRLVGLECQHPNTEYNCNLDLTIDSNGNPFVSFPTPPASSNSFVGATTEWVRNTLTNRLARVTVSPATHILQNQCVNTFNTSYVGTHTFTLPAKSDDTTVSRHFYLYLKNSASSAITVKFSRTADGESTASLVYYFDNDFTPVASIAASALYLYEFTEFAGNAFYIKQIQMTRKTTLDG